MVILRIAQHQRHSSSYCKFALAQAANPYSHAEESPHQAASESRAYSDMRTLHQTMDLNFVDV